MDELNRKEVEKKRNIVLGNLSDEDCERLFERCGYSDISVSELFENFVRDLVYSDHSNGSDEEYLANRWFERCRFGICQENSLLQYLTETGMLDEFMKAWVNVKETREELHNLKMNGADAIDLKKYKDNPEYHPDAYVYMKEIKEDPNRLAIYMESLEEFLPEAEKEYEWYLKQFEEEFLEVNPEADMQKEVEKVQEWWEQKKVFMQGQKEEKTQKEEEVLDGNCRMHRPTKVR